MYAFLAWRNLKLCVIVLAAVLPVYLLRFEIAGVPSTMLESLIWILIAVWFVKGFIEHRWKFTDAYKKNVHGEFKTLRLSITLILVAGVISIFTAPDLFQALGIFKAYFVEPLLIFVLVSSVCERNDLPKLFTALGASALMLSVLAIAQKLTGLGIPEPWDTARRVTSVFPYPNALGLFLAPILSAIPFLFMRAKHNRNFRAMIFWSVTFVAGAIAIFFSETQGAWIAVPVSIFLITLLRLSKNAKALAITSASLVVISLLILFPPSSQLSSLSSLEVRQSQWHETWSYLSNDYHWVLGAGFSGYPTALEPYHEAVQYEIFQYPHNIFLNFWVELGLLGLIGFVCLAVQVARLIRQNKGDLLVLATFAGLIEMLIHGLVDVPYFKNDLAVLTWLLIATVLICNRKS
jgi:O-antigen ligase